MLDKGRRKERKNGRRVVGHAAAMGGLYILGVCLLVLTRRVVERGGGCKKCTYVWRPSEITTLFSHSQSPSSSSSSYLQQARTKSGSPRAEREARRRCKNRCSRSLSLFLLTGVRQPTPPLHPSSHTYSPSPPSLPPQHRPLSEEGMVRHQGSRVFQDPCGGQDPHHAHHRYQDRFRGAEGPCVRGEPG